MNSALALLLPINAQIVILSITLVYVTATLFIQRKLSNMKRVREIQLKITTLNTELKDMVKRNAASEELNAKYRDIMPLMNEQMRAQFKPIFITIPLFLLVYYVLIPALPFYSIDPTSIKTLFFWSTVGMGGIAAIVILFYDKKKAREEHLEKTSKTYEANKTISE